MYGSSLILDIHEADPASFTRTQIERYFTQLCELIDMQKCKLVWWDDVDVADDEKQTSPHTKGTSAVQFILTSSIVIHTLDELGAVYVDLFSCKSFDHIVARDFTERFFGGKVVTCNVIARK